MTVKTIKSSISSSLIMGLVLAAGSFCFSAAIFADDSDVASRIRPVVTLDDILGTSEQSSTAAVTQAEPVVEEAAPAVVETASVKSALDLYNGACMACHTTGAANAPKIGDAAAWQARVSLGVDGLVSSAKAGKGAMPPNGASTYNEAEMRTVIKYMLSEAGLS